MTASRAIPERETLTVEFKSDRKRLPDEVIVDTVVALANTEGGALFLGVEDDGTPTGIHKSHRDVTCLGAFIGNHTVPSVPVRVSVISLDEFGAPSKDGLPVIEVSVPKSLGIVATASGKLLRRRLKPDGSPESVPMYPYELVSRLTSLGQLDYSALPLPDSSVSDLDPDEIRRLRQRIRQSQGADQTLLELADQEVLTALHLLTTVDGKPVPTVAGLLMVGTPDALHRLMPTSKAVFQVLEGTEVRVNQDLEGPLVQSIERIVELFEPWNPEREVSDGLFRASVPEFGKRAFREALVNAFGHRDYAQMGRVRVSVADEGLTVASPGGFIEGVTLDNLLTVEPRGRNECLMNAMKRVGLAEKTGRGIDRIYEGALAYGRPLPDYSGSTSATVSVFMPRSAPDETFMALINERAEEGKPLSLNALLVLDVLKKARRLTMAEVTRAVHLPEAVVRATLEQCLEEGLIEGRGTGASRSYLLSSEVDRRFGLSEGYVRQAGIDKVRHPEMVVKLASEQNGVVTRRDVESLLQVSSSQARRLLEQLTSPDGPFELVGSGRGAAYRLKAD